MKQNIYCALTLLGLLIPTGLIAQKKDCSRYIDNAQYTKALECLQSHPKSSGNILDQVRCYKALGQYDKSIALIEKLVEDEPDDSSLRVNLGNLYFENLNYRKSLECYDQLLKTDPENIYFLKQKADALFGLEDYKLSLCYYKEINRREPSNYNLRNIGLCYENLQVKDSAATYYLRAYRLDSTDRVSATKLVNNCLAREDYASALSFSQSYLKIDSLDREIVRLNAYSAYRLGKYKDAILKFEKSLAIGDSSLIVNRSLGISYFQLGLDSLSDDALKRAYLQDTTNTNVVYTLALVNQDLDKPKQAVDYFTKLLEMLSPFRSLLFYANKKIAESYNSLDLSSDALLRYQQALLYMPDVKKKYQLYFDIAEIYELKFHDPEKASEFYRQYVDALKLYKEELKKDPNENEDEPIKKIDLLIDKYQRHIAEISSGIVYPEISQKRKSDLK